ncbi:MAG: SOS response-associated peptidase [Moorea sp. SIO3G5]|nr:SOS response-associated peptidase [Moorena sp. SIO3G5]
MCGRFTLTTIGVSLARALNLDDVPTQEARYNIAPTQLVATVLNPSNDSERQWQLLRWGLIPSWAKDIKIGAKLINARAETVAEKPAFRSAFRRRRCLVVADGFYEWRRKDGKKQPLYFQIKDKRPFAFAGLWERWKNPAGEIIASCTIITTVANDLISPIHDRMPVILEPSDYDLWLHDQVSQRELLQPLLIPYDAQKMSVYPVSTTVNNVRNNSPDCIIPVEINNNSNSHYHSTF